MRRALPAGLLVALAVLSPSASAASRTVHLTGSGPAPASLTVKAGDVVVFVNDDTVPHQVRSQGGWQFDSGAIPPGQSSGPTPRLTAPGTYRYSDLRGIVVLPQTFAGSLTVPAPRPTPPPTRSPSPAPRPTRSTTPSPHASPAVTPSPSGTPSPAPPATPSPTKSPRPTQSAVAPPPPSPTPTPLYGDPQALVQGSPHRYGLPALVAGVALGGVLSLLVRFLLSLPEGRRTGSG